MSEEQFPKRFPPIRWKTITLFIFVEKKNGLEPFVLPEGFPFGEPITKSHQQIIVQ